MIDSRLLAEYSRLQIVRDRNYVGLLLWAAARAALPIPEARPTDEWIRLRLVAERIPLTPELYATRTLAFFVQDPATQAEVRAFLKPDNDDATEGALNDLVIETIDAFMPRFARTEIAPPQVAQWAYDHNF